jgi:hypothetical protein
MSPYGAAKRQSVNRQKRFAVGAKVRIIQPGINGTVMQLDDEPTVMGEYWHTIRTTSDDTAREPGCNLELVPKAVS